MSTITTLLRFQVDNRDAKRKIKELRDEQTKYGSDAEKFAKKRDEEFKVQIDQWAKIAAGIAAVVGAYKVLQAAAERYAKIARLEAAAVGADIAGIQQAAGGLITRYEALQVAAAGLNGKFKLNQEEMELVARASVNIRNRLGDDTTGGLTNIYKELTKAIVESNTEGLKKFGISVKAQEGTLQAHREIIKALADENERAGDNILRAGDEAIKANVKWQDTLDRLTEALGRIAVALAPIVEAIAVLAEALGNVAHSVADVVDGVRNLDGKGILKGSARVTGAILSGGLSEVGIATFGGGDDGGPSLYDRYGRRVVLQDMARRYGAESLLSPFGTAFRALGGVGVSGGARGAGGGGGLSFGTDYGGTTAPLTSRVGFTGDFAGVSGIDFGSLGAASRFALGGGLGAQRGAAGAIGGGLFGGARGALGGVDAQTFDTVIQGSQAATMALGTLQQAGVAAFAAMATGAESMGGAIRRALADGVMAMGSQLTAKAVYHGVYALGSLAFGDIRGASTHGAAAGKAAAGAAALAVLARGMGAGQRGGAGGGGYAGALPGAAAGAVGGGGVNTERVYVVPVGLDDDPRSTRKRIADSMDRANRENGGTSTVEYR